MTDTFPTEDMELTHILVVSDFAASVVWYRDILGADLQHEYGGTSAVFAFNGAWLLVVKGGGPTEDKPTVTFDVPADPDRVSHAMTICVKDCRAAHETVAARGASFRPRAVGVQHRRRSARGA